MNEAPGERDAGAPALRRVAVVGRLARAGFSLDDLPGTSGRLDVLVRSLRAALLLSHGVRRDVVAYLVLLGDAGAPRVVRVEGSIAAFLRPDERHLASSVRSALAIPASGPAFVAGRHGLSLAHGGLEVVLDDCPGLPVFVLDRGGEDARSSPLPRRALFVLGDHLGLDADALAILTRRAPRSLSVGPLMVQTEDALSILWNELDRRDFLASSRSPSGGPEVTLL